MQLLTVINDALGTMGEAPLNAEDDPHPFRSAVVSILNTADRGMQARGWWFNREKLTLTPGALDGGLYLPGDAVNVRTEDPTIVQRYRRMYDTANGTYVFTKNVEIELIRLIPYKQTPELYADYIRAEAVLRFQKRYDGDSTKTRELARERDIARMEANAEETRQVGANLLDSNVRLSYIKSRVRMVRGQRF
jgi:hypothetical protein